MKLFAIIFTTLVLSSVSAQYGDAQIPNGVPLSSLPDQFPEYSDTANVANNTNYQNTAYTANNAVYQNSPYTAYTPSAPIPATTTNTTNSANTTNTANIQSTAVPVYTANPVYTATPVSTANNYPYVPAYNSNGLGANNNSNGLGANNNSNGLGANNNSNGLGANNNSYRAYQSYKPKKSANLRSENGCSGTILSSAVINQLAAVLQLSNLGGVSNQSGCSNFIGLSTKLQDLISASRQNNTPVNTNSANNNGNSISVTANNTVTNNNGVVTSDFNGSITGSGNGAYYGSYGGSVNGVPVETQTIPDIEGATALNSYIINQCGLTGNTVAASTPNVGSASVCFDSSASTLTNIGNGQVKNLSVGEALSLATLVKVTSSN